MSTSTGFDALTAAAVQAASAGDTAAAATLLRQALAAQETALGPRHPDLAVTLNNLALMLERQGALDEAGTCYHRAYAIASAALGPDSPAVQISRANLEAFVHSHGASFEIPADVRRGTLSDFGEERPAWDEQVLTRAPKAVAPHAPTLAAAPVPVAAPPPSPRPPASPDAEAAGHRQEAAEAAPTGSRGAKATRAPSDTPARRTDVKEHTTSAAVAQRPPAAARTGSTTPAASPRQAAARRSAPPATAPASATTTASLMTRPWVLAVAVLAVAALGWMLFGGRDGGAVETPAAAVDTSAPVDNNLGAPPADEPPPAPAPVAPRESAPAPAIPAPPLSSPTPDPVEPAASAPARDASAGANTLPVDQPPAADTTIGETAMEVVDGRVCSSLVRTDNPWRCAAVNTRVSPGALYYYTRVRSDRDGVVRHRWTRDGALVAERALTIRANPREGFRTFSQQTVSPPGVWHVSAIDSDGRVIDEHRFDVLSAPGR